FPLCLLLVDAVVSLVLCGHGIPKGSVDHIPDGKADILVEVTPLRISPRQIALDHVRAALQSGKHVITANKGPVVYHYRELRDLARRRHVGFRYEGTVMDGAPVFSLFQESLRGGRAGAPLRVRPAGGATAARRRAAGATASGGSRAGRRRAAKDSHMRTVATVGAYGATLDDLLDAPRLAEVRYVLGVRQGRGV